ncbi:YraN family protein [Rhodoflexus sp.]
MNKKEKGAKGEAMAAAHLQAQGYEIISRNYKPRGTEIDIIAQKAGTVVFVEVKSRATNDFGYPEESVNAAKQGRIKRAAEYFIAEQDWHGDIRFDIIAITWSDPPELLHFEDAFY